jgi:putative transposase
VSAIACQRSGVAVNADGIACACNRVLHGHARRLSDFDYLGKYSYFVTSCVAEKRPAFTTGERVDCVRAQVLRTCREHWFEETASVYMPDHVHFLFRGLLDESAFVPFMTVLRQRSAIEYKRLTGEALWQRGYFDRVLRPSDDVFVWLRYMLNNPLRTGLIAPGEVYPFYFARTTDLNTVT